MKKNYLIYWKYHLESRLYMFRKLTLYLFLLLASIGLTYDTQSYTSGALSGSAYGIIGLSTLKIQKSLRQVKAWFSYLE